MNTVESTAATIFLQTAVSKTKNINPQLPSGPVHPYQLEESISNFRGVWHTFSFLFYFEWIFLLANNADPDQTPQNAASDLGLHCLPMSHVSFPNFLILTD